MPIIETLPITSYDASLFYDADLVSVGESFARLSVFVQGSDAIDLFRCDAGTLSSLKRAAARITDQPKSKSVSWTEVRRTANGRKVWKRLSKSQTPKQNEESRQKAMQVYSSDDVRAGVKAMREAMSVAIRRQATADDNTIIVALVRSSDEHTDNV